MRRTLAVLASLADETAVDAYVVGGTVRDVLLERRPVDLDLAVSHDALAFARRAADVLGGRYVELDDERSVARIVLKSQSAAHAAPGPPEDAADIGTRAIGAFCDDRDTPPSPTHASISYIDLSQLQGDLAADMRRRDFTIDALAVALTEVAHQDSAAVVDIYGGLPDLAAGIVRMNNATVFDADPLRTMRAVRIAADLRFTIEAATADAIRASAPLLLEAAAERRRDELARLFSLDDAYSGLRLLDSSGLLDVLLPEVAIGRGVEQPKEHAYDVFEHNMRTVEVLDALLADRRPADLPVWLWDEVWDAFGWCGRALRRYFKSEPSEGRSRGALVKLAGLLHDVAKPQTRELRDGRVRFFGHADLGSAVSREIMRRMRFSSKESAFVASLVAEHLRPVQLAQIGEVPSRRALHRFYNDLGDAVPAVLFLSRADAASARGREMTQAAWATQVRYMNSLIVRSVEDEGIVHPPRLLSGRDIMSILRIGEGPEVGRLLGVLQEAQAAGEVADAEAAKTFIRQQARRDIDASRASG